MARIRWVELGGKWALELVIYEWGKRVKIGENREKSGENWEKIRKKSGKIGENWGKLGRLPNE